MTNRIEDAARAEAQRQWHAKLPYNASFERAMRDQEASAHIATYLSEWLLYPENVERMARALGEHGYSDHHIGWCICGEKPIDMSDHTARAALRAIIEGEGS